MMRHPDLLVGLSEPDDAGVFRIDAERALVQTVDYFAPVVDDPAAYGRIAAANALSDVYAMGGRPLTALNILCFPRDREWRGAVPRILAGAAEKVVEAGAVVVGGHTVQDPEPKFGLAVTGLVHPDRIVRKGGGRPGDLLFLTKPIGTGILTTAMKKGEASGEEAAAAIGSMEALNRAAAEAMCEVRAEGGSDVTGYSLLGTLWEMVRAAGICAEVDVGAIPFLPGARRLAGLGIRTRMTEENRKFVEGHLEWDSSSSPGLETILFDPQTSGGLLVAIPERKAGVLQNALASRGVSTAVCVGRMGEGPPRIRIRGSLS
jgi:selenide,water dikinase